MARSTTLLSPQQHPPQPPVPFSDFQLSFDPELSGFFPDPPSIPPSSDLFSPAEASDIFVFLDNFNWEFDLNLPLHNSNSPQALSPQEYIYTNVASSSPDSSEPTIDAGDEAGPSGSSQRTSSAHRTVRRKHSPSLQPKSLLTSSQKRTNHILSEQKRRNAIREGYAKLTALLAPAGAPPGMGMPTRGRPKGSGSNQKGQSAKGKSGVLLRAVEYVRWLEAGRDALAIEVQRLEAAAGLVTT